MFLRKRLIILLHRAPDPDRAMVIVPALADTVKGRVEAARAASSAMADRAVDTVRAVIAAAVMEAQKSALMGRVRVISLPRSVSMFKTASALIAAAIRKSVIIAQVAIIV